jgi:putative SOS response-associated peptidase YedK
MCGRFALWAGREEIEAGFGVRLKTEPATGYNIAPSRDVTAIRAARDGGREAALLRWGLVPSWSRGPDSGYRMINARADTVFQKPAYKAAIRRRRCLVPASAFFEWKRMEKGKQPYLIRLRGEEVFGLAGLWEYWQNQDSGETIESCAILTTRPNRAMRELHDRMPVIVAPQSYSLWLDPRVGDEDRIGPLLEPLPEEKMRMHPVSREVNNPAKDSPSVVRPLKGEQ